MKTRNYCIIYEQLCVLGTEFSHVVLEGLGPGNFSMNAWYFKKRLRNDEAKGTATEEKTGAQKSVKPWDQGSTEVLVSVEEKVQRGGREGGEKVRKAGSSSLGRLCGSEGKRDFVFRQWSQ